MGSHTHYRTFGADAQENKGVRRVAGIRAGFANDFAKVLGCKAQRILTAIDAGRVEPFTAVGSPDDPERFALSFREEEYEHLKELVA